MELTSVDCVPNHSTYMQRLEVRGSQDVPHPWHDWQTQLRLDLPTK